jgi:hypothetical protein
MAALFKDILSEAGASRVHTYRAQADLCRRLAAAGHLGETRQSLEDIAASYDRLADDMDFVTTNEMGRSSRQAGDVQGVQRRRFRMRRAADFRIMKGA